MKVLNKLSSAQSMFGCRFANNVKIPFVRNLSLHHAKRTWLYSAEPHLMFDSLSFQPSLLQTKLDSIRIWFLNNLSVNQNIYFHFSYALLVFVMITNLSKNSILAILVLVSKSGCTSKNSILAILVLVSKSGCTSNRIKFSSWSGCQWTQSEFRF